MSGAVADVAARLDESLGSAVAGLALVAATVAFLLTDLFITIPGGAFVLLEVAILWAIYGILALGLNLQFGYTGIINFGYFFFFLLGGYTFGLVTAPPTSAVGQGLGMHWAVGVAAAVVVTAALGVVIGLSTVRLRGDFLALVTLAALEVAIDVVTTFNDVTGGTVGLYGIPRLVADQSGNTDTTVLSTFVLFFGLLLVVYGGITRISDAPFGRVLRAIRSDELVAQSLGKDTNRYKIRVFTYGAVLAGVAGVLLAAHQGAVAPRLFNLNPTIILWIGLFLGGAANHRGVLAGVAIILGIRLFTRFLNTTFAGVLEASQFGAIRMILIGLILIVIIRYRPAGIWGEREEMEGIV